MSLMSRFSRGAAPMLGLAFKGSLTPLQGQAQQALPLAYYPMLLRTIASSGAAQAEAQQQGSSQAANFVRFVLFGGIVAGGAFSYSLFTSKLEQRGSLIATPVPDKPQVKDYEAVRSAIANVLDKDGYDDGSYGPLLVRLAWHAAGTYDKATSTGGSDGATMRFAPECEWGANAGLKIARDLLDPIKKQFPWLSYADLWTLAGCVAIEEMGGPHIKWRPGRSDKADGSTCVPDGRLPDAKQGAAHIRAVFSRMGFNDQEMVALSGAHSLGRCHTDRSGFLGPWTNAPTTFSNLYFQELLNRTWRKKSWNGPLQYEDEESGKLMMLPTDMALVSDRVFKKWTELYAKDEDKFFQDFADAFSKLMELGVKFSETGPAPA